jgi:hypothetical protein
VWVVFEGHGYYLDSIWTTREPALARATVIAEQENGLINPDWRTMIEGRYLQQWQWGLAIPDEETT